MARQQLFSPVNAFIQGRAARQDYDYGQTRNALAQMELEAAPQEMARRNRLADIGAESAQQELDANKARTAYATLRQALSSGNAREFMLRDQAFTSNFKRQHGLDFSTLTDEQAKMELEHLAGVMAGKAGIVPEAKPELPQLQQTPGPNGSTIVTRGNQMQVVQPPRPERASDERLVQISDEQGNPKWVRESDAVGKPAYVARDKPAAADLKYQREIKTKIPRLNAALRRMDRVEAAVEKIAKNRAFDGGELDQFVINRTEDGRELIAAAAQLLPELTALTRVPGIGSQSDLETRLANLQFPSSEFPPEVNRRNAAELRAFLSDLKDAYTGAETEIQSAEVQSLLHKYAPQ